jgi:hypothetical protein
MRYQLLGAVLLLPVSLVAQYPTAGRYTMQANQAGSEQRFPRSLEVRQVGDSTTLIFGQQVQDSLQVIPLAGHGVIPGGFYFEFGTTRCPFVRIEDRWEAICANQWNAPQFVFTLPGKADPPTE